MKYDKNHALLSTSIPGLPEPARGKVRDVYDLGDSILFVATDRISAYDCIMPDGIPGKGRILTQMSLFWFKLFGDAIPNHLLCADADQYPESLAAVREDLRGRSMLVRKLRMLPVECIVRGYLAGSGWKEYQQSRTVTGIPLRDGYVFCDKLDEPIFTPTTKEESGHDMAINAEQLGERHARRQHILRRHGPGQGAQTAVFSRHVDRHRPADPRLEHRARQHAVPKRPPARRRTPPRG